MRINRIILLALGAVLLVSATLTGSRSAARAYELNPCDPAPSQIRICRIEHGTFDFVTCRCVLP
jgi:hypothetical protein